jgi:hypothetical protein
MLDHNISPRIADALHALFHPPHSILSLRKKFAIDCQDIEWIAKLDEEGGWAVLTRDLGIRFKPHERALMGRSRIVFFFIDGAWRQYGVEEMAARLIRLMPKMAQQVEIMDRGIIDLPINAGSKLRARHF